jgi:2-haloacid dehalogenase
MTATLGFDVYGTLIDTAGIARALEAHVGERAAAFAALWRTKQLEYAFRHGLMQQYRDFAVCTREALDYCCLHFRAAISGDGRRALMETYRALPAYPDVAPGLARFARSGFRQFAFSMGRRDDLDALLDHAGIARHFEGVVSLQTPQLYKPNPRAYAYFLAETGAAAADAWLVSGNPFDVLGAVGAGINGAWVKRSPDAVLDPWELAPTLVADDLPALCDALRAVGRARPGPTR